MVNNNIIIKWTLLWKDCIQWQYINKVVIIILETTSLLFEKEIIKNIEKSNKNLCKSFS